MKASENCIDLIEEFEGFRSEPYVCPGGIPTIGFGSTRYADGTSVSMGDDPMNREQAKELLTATLTEYEQGVEACIDVDLTQNQFDALVDFAYNLGVGALRTSTLARKVNAGDMEGAANEFGRWVNGGGKVLPGLVKRRAAERVLFES